MNKYSTPADQQSIDKTIAALKANGINSQLVQTAAEAKDKVFELLPDGAEVLTMTSVTLENSGIAKEINESGKYDSVRSKLNSMDRQTDGLKMQKLGAAPEYTVGSVHAVTEDGKIIIASNTGSQLPAEAYGSAHVILVVGTQKITSDLDEGMKRLYDYVLPLESDRAHKAYGVAGSFVSKILIINKEVNPERINIIFVNENIGF